MDNNNFNPNNNFYPHQPQKPFTDRGGADDQNFYGQNAENANSETPAPDTAQETPVSAPADNSGENSQPSEFAASDVAGQTEAQSEQRHFENSTAPQTENSADTQSAFNVNDAQQTTGNANEQGFGTPDFSNRQSGANAFNVNHPLNGYNQYGYNPNQGYNPQQNFNHTADFGGQPGYYRQNYNNQPGYSAQQPYVNPQQQGYNTYQNVNPQQYSPYSQAMPPKKKVSVGLIAVIAVLAVLCFGSLITSIVLLSNENQNNIDSGSYSFFGSSPYNYYEPDDSTDETTESQPKHEESDYSDKADESYEGLNLNSKPKDKNSDKYNSETAINKISDSVVGVLCYLDDNFDENEPDSQGSGIIISSDGYVVTNSHVIDNSKTDYIIRIATADGKTYTAGVIGYDERTDIAVLKMDNAKDLKAAAFGKSSEIQIGEDAIVVGNPGGIDFQNSITKGIISAVDREVSNTSLVKYIQTDAAINPGNSGGPVVNIYGQVIGIATSKIVSEQYEGMGFAIPVDTAKTSIDSLIKYGYVKGRVKLGITGRSISKYDASQTNMPQGIYVESVERGGPCDESGIKTGCVITEVNGVEVDTFSDVYKILEEFKPGDKIEISYYPPNAELTTDEVVANVTLQENK